MALAIQSGSGARKDAYPINLSGDQSIASSQICQNRTGQLWSFVCRAWKAKGFATVPAGASPPLPTSDEQEAQSPASWLYTSTKAPIVTVKVSTNKKLLEDEYNVHRQIEFAFDEVFNHVPKIIILPHVPRCISFEPLVDRSKLPENCKRDHHMPSYYAVYEMEYIRPFNIPHVNYLVKRHLSYVVQDKTLANVMNSNLVVKVCLGDLRPLTDKWQVGLDTRPAYLDQLQREGIHIDNLSEIMGSSLAVLHWYYGIDGAGVEFVLGCKKRGSIRLWLTSFSRCRSFERTADGARTQLVDAIMTNNLCWPRWINLGPFRQIWYKFRMAYINMASLLHEDDEEKLMDDFLPSIFINELEKTRGPCP